jgi:glycerol-3-phosphate dehydrogenase (NAD(P)+)
VNGVWKPAGGGLPRVAVVGAGSWGTAFARHLALMGTHTVLLARRSDQAEHMRRQGRNPDYLDFLDLPDALDYGVYPDPRLKQADLVVLAVPSRVYRDVLASIAPHMLPGAALLSLTKGLDPASRSRLSEVAAAELKAVRPFVAVLSGPNQAEEVALGQPTATVIASNDQTFARALQALISNRELRAYVNRDLIGVELAGAVKNVVALATGMSDGLGFGDNARAALVTRGLAEMSRLGLALGADVHTFAGLAGLGDLVGTCTSRHSRNRMAGELIAQGFAPTGVEEEMGMVAEGLTSAPVILELARMRDVEMPITENVVSVIREGKGVADCVRDLMARRPRSEAW